MHLLVAMMTTIAGVKLAFLFTLLILVFIIAIEIVSPRILSSTEIFSRQLVDSEDTAADHDRSGMFDVHSSSSAIQDTSISFKYPKGVTVLHHEKTAKFTPNVYNSTPGGFALAENYWEQSTSASRNMQYLQCWAGKLNMSVVEPFITTTFTYPPPDRNPVKFSDIFDMEHWTNLSSNHSLVSWEAFLKRAPRNLIQVNIGYSKTGKVEAGDPGQYRQGCPVTHRMENLVKFLTQHEFTVVRKICINFVYKSFSMDEFYAEVFGKYEPSRSTVIFNQWRGIGAGSKRVRIVNSTCSKVTAHFQMRYSQRLVREAEKYALTYMKTTKYIAVMIRVEKIRNLQHNVTDCFHLTLEKWRTMVNDTGINSTFLAADVGKYGSGSFKYFKDHLQGQFQDFFVGIYGKTLTIKQWESTFEDVSGTENPAYIAALQKTLAACSKCLLHVGGGSFQGNTVRLYMEEHAPEERCMYSVPACQP